MIFDTSESLTKGESYIYRALWMRSPVNNDSSWKGFSHNHVIRICAGMSLPSSNSSNYVTSTRISLSPDRRQPFLKYPLSIVTSKPYLEDIFYLLGTRDYSRCEFRAFNWGSPSKLAKLNRTASVRRPSASTRFLKLGSAYTDPTMPRRKALIIGINYFGTSHQLNGCINDAYNCRNFLIQDRGFSPAPHGQ